VGCDGRNEANQQTPKIHFDWNTKLPTAFKMGLALSSGKIAFYCWFRKYKKLQSEKKRGGSLSVGLFELVPFTPCDLLSSNLHVITVLQQHFFLHRYHPLCIPLQGDLPGSLNGGPSISMTTNSAPGGQHNGSTAAKVLAAPANGWTRKDRPCDACRRRKSRCIIPDGTDTCMMCHSRSEECTFVENPQRRKRRKVETGENSPEANKPRFVHYGQVEDVS
jgi:hypothetical protein